MRVSYSRLYSLGNFENEKIEFEDAVQPGETHEQAYERARAVVEAEHVKSMNQREQEKAEQTKLWKLQNQVADTERKLREVDGSWRRAASNFDRLRALLAAHGIDLPDLDLYQRPPQPGQLVAGDDDTVICPHCRADITGQPASAWSGPEPECEPGFLCPQCQEFIADE